MSRIHIHKQVSALILLTAFSASCSDSKTALENYQTPVVTESAETNIATPEPDRKKSEAGTVKASPTTTSQKGKPLDLSVDSNLQGSQRTSETHTKLAEDNLLPDLFAAERAEESVSVKGQLLMNDGAADLSNSIDGAGISIQIDTE